MPHVHLQWDKLTIEAPKLPIDSLVLKNQVIVATENPQVADIEHSYPDLAKPVCLNLENLQYFEVVERQYQRWGVVFQNCIALLPSNPAFPSLGNKVLMGAPKSGMLEAIFEYPVQSVSALVTSSQRLVWTAYDRDRNVLTQSILDDPNLANSDSPIPPNIRLTLRAKDIYRVHLCAFDGQFIISDFSFSL
jgi:hypothetical protein